MFFDKNEFVILLLAFDHLIWRNLIFIKFSVIGSDNRIYQGLQDPLALSVNNGKPASLCLNLIREFIGKLMLRCCFAIFLRFVILFSSVFYQNIMFCSLNAILVGFNHIHEWFVGYARGSSMNDQAKYSQVFLTPPKRFFRPTVQIFKHNFSRFSIFFNL